MQYTEVFGSARLDLVFIACLVSIAVIVKACWNRRKNLPPGPFCLPVLGHIPLLINEPHRELMKLGQKYGDIFSVGFGSEMCIVLNRGEAAREILSKPELSDRPSQSRSLDIPDHDPFFGNGLKWQEHKKFFLKVFHDLNRGKALEERMKVEIKKFLDILLKQNGKTFDVGGSLLASVNDIMAMTIFGEPFGKNSSEKEKHDRNLKEALEVVEKSMFFILFPWATRVRVIGKVFKMDKLNKLCQETSESIIDVFRERKEVPPEERIQSFLTSYIDEMENPSSSKSTFSEIPLAHGIITLYIAGTESTTDSLVWAIYAMAVYGDVQTKVQKEIDEIVGSDRMPSYSDQKDMKYTQAVLMEMRRWITIIPLGVRRVNADTNFGTYKVPKDTFVFVNHYAIHHDPRSWDDPDDFKPERFLSADGKHILKNDNLMPFSYGKRSCAGEGIALMEMFLFFTSILQKFRVKLPEGDKPNFEGYGSAMYRKKYKNLCFVQRDN